MKKTSKYIKKLFESTGASSDTSANIYESMLLSEAWKDLTANQKTLYLYCKAQYYGEKNIYESNKYSFTMSKNKWLNKYGIYNKGNEKAFYRDMEGLINHGFIACIICGALARRKNIYIFNDKWQKWGTAQFNITNDEMTKGMLDKKFNKRDI